MNEVNGQVAALEAAVLALISSHPNADGIRDTLRQIRRATSDGVDFSTQPEYAEGWNRTMDMLTTDIPPVG